MPRVCEWLEACQQGKPSCAASVYESLHVPHDAAIILDIERVKGRRFRPRTCFAMEHAIFPFIVQRITCRLVNQAMPPRVINRSGALNLGLWENELIHKSSQTKKMSTPLYNFSTHTRRLSILTSIHPLPKAAPFKRMGIRASSPCAWAF